MRIDSEPKNNKKQKKLLFDTPEPWIKDQAALIKRERDVFYISDESDDEDENGSLDTKFPFPKYNNNDKDKHSCMQCEKSFRDRQMLRNHISNHKTEIYRCMKCLKIYRSERSFAVHVDTHNRPKTFTCPVQDCGAYFNLKTSLTNHMQKHQDPMVCKKCGNEYQYRQGYLEHTTYRHLASKSIACPGCTKMFWTPTQMRSHKTRRHGSVSDEYEQF